MAAQREYLWLQIFERVVSGKILFFGFVVRKLETQHRSNKQADATAATKGFLFGLQIFELCGLEPSTSFRKVCYNGRGSNLLGSGRIKSVQAHTHCHGLDAEVGLPRPGGRHKTCHHPHWLNAPICATGIDGDRGYHHMLVATRMASCGRVSATTRICLSGASCRRR